MYQYIVSFYFKKDNYYPIKNDSIEIDEQYLKINKEKLCDIEEIKKEVTSLFSPRLGTINFVTIDTEKIDELGLTEEIYFNENSHFSIKYITSARTRNVITNDGSFYNLNTPDEIEYGSVTIDQIEKVIQYDISIDDYSEYITLGSGLLIAPYAASEGGWNQCLVKLKNGYYGLCTAVSKDWNGNVIANYIEFFKEKGLYELQTFDDYKKFVFKIKRG